MDGKLRDRARLHGAYIFDPDGHSIGLSYKICQLPGDPAIEASSLTVKPGDNLPFRAGPEPLTAPIWDVQVRLRERPPSFDAPEREYRSTVEWIEKGGLQLSELRRRHGFMVYDSLSLRPYYYVALPETAESLDATPLVIRCSLDEIELKSPEGPIYYGRRCSTTYYNVGDDLVVAYRFYDGHHPMEAWGSLDAAVRAFVRSLAAGDDP